ncbi:phosphatidylinositol-4-phosphate 5-kinase its3 [Cordyceps fumosorosea ARSEF 2679]|uniref:1-phosphatidylinositol-4-phosphate 5-kinase n=1 Tax=Cordyceps fumosorosea (strain ARSEF 2679) TaxID=1081104 RepID=A0A167YA90_CORFA|nr:phosphatidylinositol-4-phosphate 5-kinase its3 [Cordyceps fumosorosea ARSEF 2679]OAA66057.1 phosphatidylinositol-4-phosphate 5-kinase its3 [Cordyceps fumosorosea ARSEF 2679]
MPSYLADDNALVDSPHLDFLQLSHHDKFALASDKIAAHTHVLDHSRPDHTTESLDGSSLISTHDSDASGTRAMMPNENGNGTRPTSMNSYTNDDARDTHPTVSNGLTNGEFSLPDRTAPQLSAQNGHFAQNGDAKQSPQIPSAPLHQPPNPPNRASTVTLDHDEQPPIPIEKDFAPAPAAVASSSLVDVSRGAEPVSPKPAGHRFSSPPAYQPGNTSLNSSSSGHLIPPTQPPVLKQRHTLEVPKSNRPSKDGQDAALATGRFSPTSAVSGTRRASMNLGRRATRSGFSDMPRDEVAPDEDAARWAEAIRQKRASKRRRKEEEDDDRVLVGTKVDESHANWVTAYNMLTGIRVSVSRTNAKLDRELTDADFEAKQKSTFDITGNELVPSAKYDFKFKDYAPWVFRRLRALFRLDPADYLMSLTGKYILSELGSPGKSGSFFYFSRDYKYIIKTIHHSEHKFLRKILKDYYTHVQQNPNTLLSQFYGLHRVKMPYGKKIHFVVMNNLFPPHRDIHTTFDLKGSTVGRNYKEEDLEQNPRATLKDLNWLRRKRHLELGIQKKRMFLEQLRADVVLLKRLQIMDYSLLVGIHDVSRGNEENLRDKTLQVFNPGREKSMDEEPPMGLHRTPSKLETARKARELRQMIRQERPIPMGQAIDKMPDELGESHSRPGFVFNQDDGGFQATHENNDPADEIYYLGVIDCLTHYGIIKKIEHFWKGLSSDRTQISALPPDQYGDRFYNFVEGITMSSEEAQREEIRREQEAMEARLSGETPGRRNKHSIPPMPTHLPPLPPGAQHQEPRDTIDMAKKEAQKRLSFEAHPPERTIKTVSVPAENRSSTQHDRVLPVVEELGESSRDEINGHGRDNDMSAPTRAAPPPPAKDDDLEDAGQPRTYSRGSLDKKLPPLPREAADQRNGVA